MILWWYAHTHTFVYYTQDTFSNTHTHTSTHTHTHTYTHTPISNTCVILWDTSTQKNVRNSCVYRAKADKKNNTYGSGAVEGRIQAVRSGSVTPPIVTHSQAHCTYTERHTSRCVAKLDKNVNDRVSWRTWTTLKAVASWHTFQAGTELRYGTVSANCR